jgi:hypothetical protein
MFINSIEMQRPSGRQTRRTRGRHPDAKFTAPLPDGLAFTERAAAALRAYLGRAGLGDYRVFYNYQADIDMVDVGEHLDALGEAGAAWEPLPGMVRAGAGVADLRIEGDNSATGNDPGCIRLRRHEVVLARWFWVHPEDYLCAVWLCAAPAPGHYARLRDDVLRLRHARAAAEWRIVASGDTAGERVPRATATTPDAEDLVLPGRLRERVEAEVVRFFDDAAAALYASMRVPYRRGVLLHGPPGNGKTSLIRLIGNRLPRVPGLILRPGAGFDSDDLAGVIRRWTNEAPCILVIEDLDWLLKAVDVSRFLNLVDGVDAATTGGLLLIATTNHPEALDPAINNRPGRFDVVIEVPSPDEPLRLAYLRRQLPEAGEDTLRQVAADTDGLAFAHLQEVVRLSGLLALNAGRTARTDADVLAASQSVRGSHDDAVRGFPGRPDLPFGLMHVYRERLRDREE